MSPRLDGAQVDLARSHLPAAWRAMSLPDGTVSLQMGARPRDRLLQVATFAVVLPAGAWLWIRQLRSKLAEMEAGGSLKLADIFAWFFFGIALIYCGLLLLSALSGAVEWRMARGRLEVRKQVAGWSRSHAYTHCTVLLLHLFPRQWFVAVRDDRGRRHILAPSVIGDIRSRGDEESMRRAARFLRDVTGWPAEVERLGGREPLD